MKKVRLGDELDNATGLLDLALGLGGDVAGADDDGDLGDAALAEDLGVAEGKEVEDGSLLGALGLDVLVTLLGGDEGPELVEVDDLRRIREERWVRALEVDLRASRSGSAACGSSAYQPYRLHAMLARSSRKSLVKLTVTRVVLVNVGPVVVLTTGHTATTGVLAVLADTTVTGRDVAAAVKIVLATAHCIG